MKGMCNKIPFNREFHVYAVKDGEGNVEWISLYDLCRILKRKDLYESNEILQRCTNVKSFPVYGNGKLYRFIRICDIEVLLAVAGQENPGLAAICNEIRKWTASLPVVKVTESMAEKKPTANPITFTFHGQPVSFMSGNGKTYFNATQMAKGFGKSPREWLFLAGTARLRQSLVRQGKSKGMEEQIITVRGSMGATWIEYGLGLEFARWLSPEFSLWCNERIRELVTQGYAAIDPYPTDNSKYPVLVSFREALQLALAQQEEIERQQQKIEEDRPKVAFYDDFIENRDFFKSSIIAEELRITTVQLHRFLTEERICRYERKQYVVYPAYSPLQCDYPYLWTNSRGKTYACSHAKRWTKAGREYILELYRAKYSVRL